MSPELSESSRLAALGAAESALVAAGIDTARQDAEWLLSAVLGLERYGLYLDAGAALTPQQADGFRALVARRAAREPLQHLLGYEDFDGMRLGVTRDVLVPRPETEGLVEWAAALLSGAPRPIAADLGTGSGAIACALARRVPGLRVLAVERSPEAAAVAGRNARRLGLGGRVFVLVGDLLEAIAPTRARLDMVVANPPYLPSAALGDLPPEVARHEPRLALDGGPDGTAVARRIAADSARVLRAGGWLLMEMGPEQGRALGEALERAGLDRVEVRRDLAGRERYIAGRWSGARAGGGCVSSSGRAAVGARDEIESSRRGGPRRPASFPQIGGA